MGHRPEILRDEIIRQGIQVLQCVEESQIRHIFHGGQGQEHGSVHTVKSSGWQAVIVLTKEGKCGSWEHESGLNPQSQSECETGRSNGAGGKGNPAALPE